jgi:hypothetical protein
MNHKKEFHAPDGFDIANVQLTPEQKSWLAKMRKKFGGFLSSGKSGE